MVEMKVLKSRNEWLKGRGHTIGGSDASSILGVNPWMTNANLYRIKAGEEEQEDISDKDIVKFGVNAEPLMREMFKLDYPELEVFYVENNIWHNDKYPFAHASLDGWLKDKDGRMGIFENKTVNIMNSAQLEHWKDSIPDYYYCQLLHYFLVTEFEFAILKARLRWEKTEDKEVYCQIRHYRIEREEVKDDIEYLMEEEKKFFEKLKSGEHPSLKLPEI
jgi:putative phage-type endonuclease